MLIALADIRLGQSKAQTQPDGRNQFGECASYLLVGVLIRFSWGDLSTVVADALRRTLG